MIRRQLLGLVALAVGLLPACSIDGKNLEEEIRAGLEEDGLRVESIECPKSKKAKTGSKFNCTVTMREGYEVPVEVKSTNRFGGAEWQLSGKILKPKKIEDALVADHGVTEASCGKSPIVAADEVEIECEVDGAKLKLQFVGDDGEFELEDPSERILAMMKSLTSKFDDHKSCDELADELDKWDKENGASFRGSFGRMKEQERKRFEEKNRTRLEPVTKKLVDASMRCTSSDRFLASMKKISPE